jgi:hypothetical protein
VLESSHGGSRIGVLVKSRDLAPLHGEVVRELAFPSTTGCFYVPKVMAACHNLVALRDNALHLKALWFLVLSHGAEEFSYTVLPMLGAGKGDLRDTRKHPFNVVGQCREHSRDISGVKAVVETLYNLRILLVTHPFTPMLFLDFQVV